MTDSFRAAKLVRKKRQKWWSHHIPLAYAVLTSSFLLALRQQTPNCCHNRNHGLCASISSCRRFAAKMALALSGRASGAASGEEHCAWLRRNRLRCSSAHFTTFLDHSSKVSGASIRLRWSQPSHPVLCM